MKEKLKAHFLSLGPRRFVFGAVGLLVIMDLIFSYYLKLVWATKGISQLALKIALSNQKISAYELSADTLRELEQLGNNTFYAFIFIVLLNNLFFYGFYLRKKLWAQGYILFYTFTNMFLNLIFIFDNNGMGAGWVAYNIGTIFIYCYLYLGVKLLKDETTIPARGKKGR
jgi:hypothetical protein